MTEEIDFFKIMEINKPIIQQEDSKQSSVIMKVLHTRTEIRLYPFPCPHCKNMIQMNSKAFQQSRSWFEDKDYEVKPQQKKQLVTPQKSELQPKEEY